MFLIKNIYSGKHVQMLTALDYIRYHSVVYSLNPRYWKL